MEGRLQTRKWQDKNGQDRYTTEIVANAMQLLGGGRDNGASPPQPSARTPAPAVTAGGGGPDEDDDIPF